MLAQQRVTIVGLGLMGGSLALALRGQTVALYGVDTNAQTRAAALASGAVQQCAARLEELPPADMLILATPVKTILRLLAELAATEPRQACVVLDLGSTKQAILTAMAALPAAFDPVGGHPMCGKASGGWEQAEAGLFQGATFALCRLERSSARAQSLAEELARAAGAQPLWLAAAQHDTWTAATSHLAFLSSSALAAAVPLEAKPLAGPGLRSATRLATTPAEMMLDVLETNRPAVLAGLARLREELAALESALAADDRAALAAQLAHNAARQTALIPPTPLEKGESIPSAPLSKGSGIRAAARLARLPGNFFAQVEGRIRELQREGREVIRLDIGSPDLPPPLAVVQALAQDAVRPDAHGYQPHNGPAELRQAWQAYYQQNYGVQIEAESQILPLLGVKEGIFHLSQALLDPGDVALVPDPGYMTYSRGALFAGAEVYPLPLRAENGFLPDLGSIPAAILKRARLLWLNYPNNPTSATAPLAFLAEALAFAERHGILLCHDAAYARIGFNGYEAPSLLQVAGAAETAVEFYSLSKSHNLAGWRSGAVLGNPQALRLLMQMKTHLDSGGFRPVQRATIAALATPATWVAERNLIYTQRRERLLAALPALGLQAATPPASADGAPSPDATIYLWAALSDGQDSRAYCARLLEAYGISLTPGEVFGPAGAGYVRIALSTPDEQLDEALERLEQKVI